MGRTDWVVWPLVAVLLIVPFVGLLWVPAYTRAEPAFAGFPFFYWYQLAWVPVSAICTGLAYLLLRRHEKSASDRAAAPEATEGNAGEQGGGPR